MVTVGNTFAQQTEHSSMKRVLVPMDGSSQSEAALEEAFDLFPDGKVHVVHVIQVRKIAGDETRTGHEIAIEEGEEICERAEEIASSHGRTVETATMDGNAAKCIVLYAEENDIDHIVMGSTGRSGFSRLLLGSVAETVTRRAPCSVTIVRE